MKTFGQFIILAMLSFAGVCRGEPTNTFGIYLTAESVETRNPIDGKNDWLHVKLQPTPIISESDVLAYSFTNHSLSLAPDVLERAMKRLPSMSVWGIPFILVVDGERIYVGAFMSPVSSISNPAPCIIVWPHNIRDNTLQIDRGYPPPNGFATGADPRSDKRIKRALAALHKLK